MTIIALQFTAELVKVIDFRPADDFEIYGQFFFEKLICEKCEGNDNVIYIMNISKLHKLYYKNEYIQVHGFTKCRVCGNLGFIQMRRDLGNNYATLTAELSRAGKYATIMHFNVQGMKPSPNECSLIGKFVATAEVDNSKIEIAFVVGFNFIDGDGTGAAILNQKVRFIIVEDDTTASSSAASG